MKLYEYKGIKPKISDKAYIQDGVKIIGDVTIEDYASVWYNVTMRGDYFKITIKKNANIQELTTIHGDFDTDVVIGENTTVGHGCIIHGAKVGNNCLIGMGSILLNNVVIPDNCLVGAGSLITEGKTFEEGMLIVGSPAKAIRKVTDKDLEYMKNNSALYVELGKTHKVEDKLILDNE
ncbi:MAG: gamma carbonic anhydrase family protein [Bacilli bacterium]|jgi:carbonic anhydrase/acetyltransferase-like protein (isoleucine patch superfamily)|nr:gamma carbonic anhydrase family protein [Bacilli bacterium]